MTDFSFLKFAKSLDSVSPPRAIREMAQKYIRSIVAPQSPLSLRSMLLRYYHPAATHSRMLWLNAELLPPLIEKNAQAERAYEIAEEITHDNAPYAIVALCEVYKDSYRDLIVDQVTSRSSESFVETADGPGNSWSVTPSGLLTVAIDRHIVRQENEAFDSRGNKLLEGGDWITVDKFANKGILLSEIELGPGNVEIYSAHLYSGVRPNKKLGDDAEKILAIQELQVSQIADFIDRTHRRQNIAIVVGDFNIAAYDDNFANHGHPYNVLCNILDGFGTSNLRMRDLWYERVEKIRDGQQTIGYTWTHDKNSAAVCQLDGIYCNDLQPEPQFTNPDGTLLHDNYRRIDYIFVEEPSDHHSFRLDLSRPRRRSFPRKIPGEESLFLSDHLGLEVTLIASPTS